MGKAKKLRLNTARKNIGPTNGRTTATAAESESRKKALRESKVLPVVKSLRSASPQERAQAIAAINNLLENAETRGLLLKERLVQIVMEETLHDSSQKVVVHGWGALRNIALEEGYDQCIYMFRKDILTPIAAGISKIYSAIDSVKIDPSSLNNASKKLLWLYVENIVSLLTSLSETNQDILDAITKLEIHPFLLPLLSPTTPAPPQIQRSTAQCLHALTCENEDLCDTIIENPAYITLLSNLVRDPNPENCIKTVSICGILHNISLVIQGTNSPIKNAISDAVVLPILNSFLKSLSPGSSSLVPSQEEEGTGEEDQSLALQIVLEIIASIATAVQDEVDGELEIDADGDIDLMNGDDSADIDAEKGEEGDEDIEGVDEVEVEEGEGEEKEEMEIETLTSATASISITASRTVTHLIESSIPLLAHSAHSASPPIKLLATAALQNIAWTVDATVSQTTSLWHKWEKQVALLWDTCVTPVLTTNTADIELAEAVTGLAWVLAKCTKGDLDVSRGQYRAFISLYQAATSDELRTKCVGVLGCLGLKQGRVDVNKEIGVFLITLITGAPNTPADPVVEALNAVFDIYADASFDYDEPVFVQSGFLTHLSLALYNVRALVRKVDKRKFPEDRHRADEAANNLQQFIQYKKKERVG